MAATALFSVVPRTQNATATASTKPRTVTISPTMLVLVVAGGGAIGNDGAAVMVSGDTGPTHIASAVGTPLVGIYGPTRPVRNGPLAPRDVSISRDAICQCHHLRRCRLDRMCLLDIEAAEVIAAVERRLSPEPAHV